MNFPRFSGIFPPANSGNHLPRDIEVVNSRQKPSTFVRLNLLEVFAFQVAIIGVKNHSSDESRSPVEGR